jgi:protein-L-isoaspartate O-methyltransferase
MNSIADFRRFYAEFIVKSSGGADANVIEAFAAVPRENFVGPGPWAMASLRRLGLHSIALRRPKASSGKAFS